MGLQKPNIHISTWPSLAYTPLTSLTDPVSHSKPFTEEL